METFYNPEDNNVMIFKDPNIPKATKKDIILKVLSQDRVQFYKLRSYLHHNYFYYIVRMFTDKGDEDIFKEVTLAVCKDIVNDPFIYDQYGNKGDCFANSFLSQKIVNESPLNVLAQDGKFEFIDILLDCIKEYGLNDRMDVQATDNYNKTLVDYAVENKKLSSVRVIAEKHGKDFNFDINKKSQSGKTMDQIMQSQYSPLVKFLIDDDCAAFEEYFVKALEGEEEGLSQEDWIDSLGFSFIHCLCLEKDYLFLDLVLHYWEECPEKVSKVMFFTDIDEEMNRHHKVSGYTPITSIFASGYEDKVDYIFKMIFIERWFKIDISVKDCKNRNILHLILGNRNLSHDYKLEIFNKFFAILSESSTLKPQKTKTIDLYNEIDDDGFSPLATFVCQLTPESQKKATNNLLLEFLIEKTSFDETILKVKEGSLVHPFIPCIQLGLEAVYSKLLEMNPELSSTIFFCDYSSGRTTLEFAFTSRNEFFINQVIDSLDKISSFVVHNNRITLFEIWETIFRQLKYEGDIKGDENPEDHKNKILELYQKLAEKVYTESRASSGSKANQILQNFKLKDFPKAMKDMKPAHKLPKGLMEKQKKAAELSANIHEANEKDKRKILNYESLFYLSFENDNFITFPYISDVKKDFKLDITKIMVPYDNFDASQNRNISPSKIYLNKHKTIFDYIVQKLIEKEVDEYSISSYQWESDESIGEVNKDFQLMSRILCIATHLSINLWEIMSKEFDIQKVLEGLKAEVLAHPQSMIKNCSLSTILKV